MLRHRQDAEDTAQESLLRAVKYLGSWDATQPLAPWVLKIAANRCRTALGRRGRTPQPSDAVIDLASRNVAPPLGLGEELELALDVLNENHRTCFVLFYQQSLNIAEIAGIMEVPDGTVKTWLHRSRKQLAQRLRERGVVPDQREQL
jgi:RNA polymerase sigma-70 factor (ECF subfamily)